jgi:hypothetical protein
MTTVLNIWSGNLESRNHLWDLAADGDNNTEIEKYVIKAETGFVRLRIGTKNFCEQGNEELVVAQLVEKFSTVMES